MDIIVSPNGNFYLTRALEINKIVFA